jgi:hypothetical protein
MTVTGERGERELSQGEEERAEASYIARDWTVPGPGE